jgi:hypothetical protein
MEMRWRKRRAAGPGLRIEEMEGPRTQNDNMVLRFAHACAIACARVASLLVLVITSSNRGGDCLLLLHHLFSKIPEPSGVKKLILGAMHDGGNRQACVCKPMQRKEKKKEQIFFYLGISKSHHSQHNGASRR